MSFFGTWTPNCTVGNTQKVLFQGLPIEISIFNILGECNMGIAVPGVAN